MIDADPIARFHGQKPGSYPILQEFLVEQIDGPGVAKELRLTLVMRESSTTDAKTMELVFHGVRELKVDWPTWSVVRFGLIEIVDIAERGLEDLRFRVFEGDGSFAFSCRSFDVAVR